MKITAYSICWNEEIFLPWYFDFYKWVDEFVVYDNFSTDRSREIISSQPNATIVDFNTGGEQRNDLFRDVKNNCWKGVDADWVVIGDVDEFYYHFDMRDMLRTVEADVLVPEAAYTLASIELPEHWSEVVMGSETPQYRKMGIFRPGNLKQINYCAGAHHATPEANPRYLARVRTIPGLVMYHLHNVGLERKVTRLRQYRERESRVDAENKWGVHYHQTEDQIRDGMIGAFKSGEVRRVR